MSNKKNNNKKKTNNLPFSNEIKQLKTNFKQMIDEMPDEEFIDFISFLNFSFDDDFEDEAWLWDEEWESEAEKFYHKENNDINFDMIDDDNLPF